ncbi:hypothetical protein TNCV_4062361 [Trichonephila clavipes]|nr:hypothetical protein TNCV_4062361 [Trichonephila clavipes]
MYKECFFPGIEAEVGITSQEGDPFNSCQGIYSQLAHFWWNGYVNKQNGRIWTNPQVYVEAPLHPEKLTAWCALWAGGILLQER